MNFSKHKTIHHPNALCSLYSWDHPGSDTGIGNNRVFLRQYSTWFIMGFLNNFNQKKTVLFPCNIHYSVVIENDCKLKFLTI